MFLTNEELGKKDDDHKPTKIPSIHPRWSPAAGSPRSKVLKRLAIALTLGIFVYLFIANLPTDMPIRDRRHPVYRPEPDAGRPRAPGPMPKLTADRKPQTPNHAPARPPQPDVVSPQIAYNGPLMFPKLLSSLDAISSTGGNSPVNKNVLFAAASLRSAALLLPMACQMADELRNYVHFALLGGSGIDMQELRAVNGVDESCQVIFHGMVHISDSSWVPGNSDIDLVIDARPDFAATSTTDRLRQSSVRALCKLNA
jgi:hypothetical protein